MIATFQKEFFYKCMPELPRLFMAEWAEANKDGSSQKVLAPAWDKFVDMEMRGLLHFFTARSGNEIVGYTITVIYPSLHFSDTLMGLVDAFYIIPEYRGQGVAMVEQWEKLMAEQRVNEINYAIPPQAWQLKLFTKELQYSRQHYIVAKTL